MSQKSAIAFLLTVNEASLEFYQDIYQYLKGLSQFQYILVTEHIGQENKHYHIYVQYRHSKRLSVARLHGAHFEQCYGSAQQNIDYCMCEDKKHKDAGITAIVIDEEGEPKFKGGNWTIKRLRDCDDEAEIPAHLYNIRKKIREEDEVDIDIDDWAKDVKVYWIQGPSGIGKTEKAKSIVRDEKENFGTKFNRVKYENGFWSGIGKASIAIYDDFRDSHMKPSEFINFIDYNKHFLNIKHGQRLNNYKLIIITSIQKFEKIYKNVELEEPRRQWERRVEVINMYPPERAFIGGLPVGYHTDFNELENYREPLTEVEVTDDWDNSTVLIH